MDKTQVAQGLRYIELLNLEQTVSQQNLSLKELGWDSLSETQKEKYLNKATKFLNFMESEPKYW